MGRKPAEESRHLFFKCFNVSQNSGLTQWIYSCRKYSKSWSSACPLPSTRTQSSPVSDVVSTTFTSSVFPDMVSGVLSLQRMVWEKELCTVSHYFRPKIKLDGRKTFKLSIYALNICRINSRTRINVWELTARRDSSVVFAQAMRPQALQPLEQYLKEQKEGLWWYSRSVWWGSVSSLIPVWYVLSL